ncbi:MAG: methyltransferase domain-containing protein [Frankiales bacterium]|nr:methyltransferase domain-containing protein [Frankiales bacterium]
MPQPEQWLTVDEGWGRRAADFASLSEPANCREYVAVQRLARLRPGDRLLDVACGSGLALELAGVAGARVAGIDASERLVAVARERVPDGDVRVGDMRALPWPDSSFDVVTSCRGIWGTTPEVLEEVRRVLRPSGRLCLTVWGHLKAAEGSWALAPFRLAPSDKLADQSAMNALGRPGVGEQALADHGFTDVRRHDVPFAWEFPDPQGYARALASTGPAYEAIRAIGEEEFLRHAEELAAERVRHGLPLRAVLPVVAFTARAPQPAPPPAPAADASLLGSAPLTPEGQRLIDDDVEELGFVMNATRLWMHDPAALDGLFALLGELVDRVGLDLVDRGVLVSAAASHAGDPYCSAAWGDRLSRFGSPEVSAAVLTGRDEPLTERERALAAWARQLALAPRATTPEQVSALRSIGLDDAAILDLTLFVALRLAFSAVNGALRARVDDALVQRLHPSVRERVLALLG